MAKSEVVAMDHEAGHGPGIAAGKGRPSEGKGGQAGGVGEWTSSLKPL